MARHTQEQVAINSADEASGHGAALNQAVCALCCLERRTQMLGTADPTAAKSANEAVRPAEEQMEPRAWGRGKCEAAKHAPNTGSGRRVTGAGLHTEGRKRKEEGEDHRSHRPWKSLQDFHTPTAQRLRSHKITKTGRKSVPNYRIVACLSLGVQSYTIKKLGGSLW